MSDKQVRVAVSGGFDPIHLGHIRYIREAAKLGDKLIVILNSDAFLMKKKGFVFFSFEERKEILENFKGVDGVIAAVDDDQTVRKTLELVKPDIFAKGGGYTANPEDVPEYATCRAIGCKLVTNVGGTVIHSDSELSQRVRDLGKGQPGVVKMACLYCNDHPMLRPNCLYCGGKGKIEVSKVK